MKKFVQKMKQKYKKTNKKTILVYLILRLLVIFAMVSQILLGNIGNAALCILALILFTLPTIISEKFNIGEINNFYGIIPFWDTMLHTLNGFLCAGIGFSLVDLLNQNNKNINLTPLYVAIVAFCFSMTIGILWEFYEYSADHLFRLDMQKDTIVQNISSVELNPNKENIPIKVDNIEKTQIYSSDGTITTIEGGYLDLGLTDTIKDLFVNFIGAVVFSTFGYLYIKNRDKYTFVKNFIPVKEE